MSMYKDIPEDLLEAEKKDAFLSYLRVLPATLHTKKYLLLDWCEFTGVPMSKELAEAVGLPPQV